MWLSLEEAKRKSFGITNPPFSKFIEVGGRLGDCLLLIEFIDLEFRQRSVDDLCGIYDAKHVITVEQCKADWSNITSAALFLDIRFLITKRCVPCILLYANPKNKHPAFRYLGQN